MPSTITNYVVFVQNTPARAADVNANLSNHRGDLLPINETTATASDLVHDLGSTDRRWLQGYLSEILFGATTTSWQIRDATTTVGNLTIDLNSTTVVEISSSGIARSSLQTVNATTSANIDASLSLTSSVSGSWTGFFSTVTLAASGGIPVLEFFPGTAGSASNGSFALIAAATSSSELNINYLRNGVTVGTTYFANRPGFAAQRFAISHSEVGFKGYDFITTTGNVEWSLDITYNVAPATTVDLRAQNIKMAVREIR